MTVTTPFLLPRGLARRLALLAFLVAAPLFAGATHPAVSLADACTAPVVSPVACENTKPGTDPVTWEVDGAGDPSIQGYATQQSVNVGTTVNFKIKSTTSAFHIDILRLGYYQGKGARLIQGGITPSGTAVQGACKSDATTGLIDCGNWAVSASWAVPSTAVSGVYVAHLVRNDGTGDSQIIFVVRNDASHSAMVLQTSDATWQAYNTYGGNNLYDCASVCPPGNPRAYKAAFAVSYNRPLGQPYDGVSSLFAGAEYSMIRWVEANGYDVSYLSEVDVHRRGSLLLNHKTFISSGHDEYWSATQRSSVEAARAAGVNLAFFSGNEVFWKTRWASSIDGSNTQDRTLISYKDTHFDAPTDPVEWTGTWRDDRFASATDATKPENALTGQSFVINAGTTSLTVPAQYGAMRLWKNTAAATLTAGQTLTLSPATLGYEWDVDADNGFRPAGLIKLSATTATGLDAFVDYGTTVVPNSTATHNLVMYRAPSGARVFGAGTVQWAFGLDSPNPGGGSANLTMQQATVNLLADMGAQPVTRQAGLVAATASTDTTGPTVTVGTTPATVADGSKLTITGTASDLGGGVVGGVEVSADNGTTWHPATGTASWSYSWVAHGAPTAKILARATDDSGNIGAASAARSIGVSCTCSLFGTNVTPAAAAVDGGDTTAIEVGMKFTSDQYGTIKGLRFYKAATNTGTHTGSLWTAGGQRLAQATFTGETGSGWQTVTFANPVLVTPGTTYVASYYAPAGHYSATADYFYRTPAPGPNGGAIADSPPIHALRSFGTTTNGVYAYGSSSSFPTQSYGAANYWVDVLFDPTPAPGAVSGVTAVSGGKTSANIAWTAPTTGGAPTSYVITPYVGTTAATPITVTGSPLGANATVTGLTNGTTYTFTVTAVNPAGSSAESAQSASVTPLTAVAPGPPASATAEPASEQARVSWTAPATDGDSAITGYVVTPYTGTTAGTPVTVAAATRTVTITGLADGASTTFRVAAVNAVGTGSATTTAAVTPGATLLDYATPAVVDSGDTDAVELGVKFTADSAGTVSGLRFYKAAANVGPHVGTLWSAAGTRLAEATFTNESASGWQSVTFSSPVAVTANTTYVASYFAPSGRYSVTSHGLDNALHHAPLHAPGTTTSANGVYAYGSAVTFPTAAYNGSNYYVDVLYAMSKPGQPTGATATASRGSATVSWTAPTTGGAPSSYVVTPYIGTTAQPATTVNGGATTTAQVDSLTPGTSYTFTVQAQNASGPGTASAATNAVTPTQPVAPDAPTAVTAQPASSKVLVRWTAPPATGSPVIDYTVTPYVGATAQPPVVVDGSLTSARIPSVNGKTYTFTVSARNGVGAGPESTPSAAVTPQATIFDFATPATVDGGDTSAIELGVKFQASVHGSVTGIRFYKAAGNTGTHIGNLWTAGGTRLATATFAGESASGWQTVTFGTPVDIDPGTTYVASYFAPAGHYSVTSGGLAAGATNDPLRALADSTVTNGVYGYGPTSGFPASSYNGANYWVDVLFAPLADPGTPTGVTASAGRNSATVSWTAPSDGGPVASYKVTPYAGSAAQPSTVVTGSPAPTSATITGLTAGTSYTFTVQARNLDGSGPTSAPSDAVVPTAAAVPAAPTAVTAAPASSSARVDWTAPTGAGSDVTDYTVTPYVGGAAQAATHVAGTVTAATISGLSNGTDYTFTVTATNAVGAGPASGATDPVTPRATIFDFATPAMIDAGDPSSIVLGAKFTADVDGFATGIRFYKAAANTGTHIAALWTSDGQLVASATFTGESAAGWQTALFASPQPITAATTYVATYLAPNGHYSAAGAAFASAAIDNAPLHALSNLGTPNGIYVYSPSMTFPASSYNATNYFVDVLFSPAS
jgi:hypothetical protein